jgi:hypothetical protein
VPFCRDTHLADGLDGRERRPERASSERSIKSLMRTETHPEGLTIGDGWWARKDLNLGPMDYESTALTAELRARLHSQTNNTKYLVWKCRKRSTRQRICLYLGRPRLGNLSGNDSLSSIPVPDSCLARRASQATFQPRSTLSGVSRTLAPETPSIPCAVCTPLSPEFLTLGMTAGGAECVSEPGNNNLCGRLVALYCFTFFLSLLTANTGCGGATGTSHVPTPPPGKTLSSVSVSPATASINIGGTQQFTATAKYSDGSTADVSSKAASAAVSAGR